MTGKTANGQLIIDFLLPGLFPTIGGRIGPIFAKSNDRYKDSFSGVGVEKHPRKHPQGKGSVLNFSLQYFADGFTLMLLVVMLTSPLETDRRIVTIFERPVKGYFFSRGDVEYG